MLLAVAMTALLASCGKQPAAENEFVRLMNSGKNYYDQGQAEKAIPLFEQAVAKEPGRPDAHLNLANAYLLANQPAKALPHAVEAVNYDRNLAAAYFVAGCAHLRLGQFEEAVKQFMPARDLDPSVPAVLYLLGRAQQELGRMEEAIQWYQEAVKADPKHAAAHYALSQALFRAGREDEGKKELALHQQIQAAGGAGLANAATFERCKHTQARAPLVIEKPDAKGLAVTFADITPQALGPNAAQYHGPLAVLDYNHDDRNSLFAAEGTNGFRVLSNSNSVLTPINEVLPANPGGNFRQCLVGDLNNDRYEDVLVLGEGAISLFRFATNGAARDVAMAAGLKNVRARGGALVDLDFTGKLDFLPLLPEGNGMKVLRNRGNPYFSDITATSGVSASATSLRQIVIEDWNNDDLMDAIVTREGQPPLLLVKLRGGPLVPTNLPPGQLVGTVAATGDLNNDSRPDLLVGAPDHIDVLAGGINQFTRLPIAVPGLKLILLVDYDNDGWLDILAAGNGLQLWRNVGDFKFTDMTATTGLAKLGAGEIDSLVAADLDQDGDTDIVCSVVGQGLKVFRNDGGNKNHQLKLRLVGNRSNASGLGIRLEVAEGGFRVHRTVQSLPVEIGVGRREKLDSLTARWFDLAFNLVDVKPDPKASIPVLEPVLPTGSCPYLYAWNGKEFGFIADILGSAPMGLRLTDTIFIDADPHEYIWLGNEETFPARNGAHMVQITEELREVLYLDEAKLVVVDHPPGTEVQTTDNLRPMKPFPKNELWTLDHPYPLKSATRLDGSDVTELLQTVDQRRVSPSKIRIPQLRGLAEPHGLILDFGPLPTDRPLVLVLNGWLRFGGGMANVGASHDPDLPFPFPVLEVETAPDQWQKVAVDVGAPSGKTKTILVDLAGKLPPNSQRLRLTEAFELHWDRIALMERRADAPTRITALAPTKSDLHWRGFSEFADLPWDFPLTPVYDQVYQNPHWAITPTGWCTRYGPVDELIGKEDNALALLNGGDELTLSWDASQLPPKPPGMVRDFYLYTVGWDKDADFHVELGWKVDPLPWHGMDDQLYGRQPRPAFPNDDWMRRYNTRWVTQPTLKRAAR